MEQNGTVATTIDRIGSGRTDPDLGSWLTKGEAAHALGSSEKHIERLVQRGKVEQRWRKEPGRPRISIFHPGDVEKILAAQTPAFRVQETAVATSDRLDTRPTDAFAGLPALLAGLSDFAQKLNAEHFQAVYVSLDEALRITGLSAATLRTLARGGRIARLSRKYRRADLEAL